MVKCVFHCCVAGRMGGTCIVLFSRVGGPLCSSPCCRFAKAKPASQAVDSGDGPLTHKGIQRSYKLGREGEVFCPPKRILLRSTSLEGDAVFTPSGGSMPAKSFGLQSGVQNATPELLGQGKVRRLSFPGPEHR